MSLEYWPSVGRISAECRPSVDGLAIEYRPTCMSVERRPISASISAECRSTYRPSVNQDIGRVSTDISARQIPLVHKIFVEHVWPTG